MDISKYIYDYLMEYSTPVIVPELGCFKIIYKPSEVRDGRVIPPVKTVELDCENSIDYNNVFASYIARKENISIEQANKEVLDFYDQFFSKHSDIIRGRNIVIDKFGTFSLDAYRNIIFAPVDDFFKDNYGLGNAYVQNDEAQQVQPEIVFENPEPEPEPLFEPEPEPITPAEPEPVKVEEPEEQPVQEEGDTQVDAEAPIFDTTDKTRFHENTDYKKKKQYQQEQKPPKKTAPPLRRQRTGNTGNFKMNPALFTFLFLLFVGLCIFVYNKTKAPYSPPVSTIVHDTTIQQDTTEAETTDIEEEPTSDDAQDKRDALDPNAGNAVQPETKPQEPVKIETPKPKPEQPTVTQPPINTGRGRYVLIVGSFTSPSSAEAHGKKLQAAGLNYEVIDAGSQRYRVSVGSYDDIAEANRQANQVKSKPLCENVWVAKR